MSIPCRRKYREHRQSDDNEDRRGRTGRARGARSSSARSSHAARRPPQRRRTAGAVSCRRLLVPRSAGAGSSGCRPARAASWVTERGGVPTSCPLRGAVARQPVPRVRQGDGGRRPVERAQRPAHREGRRPAHRRKRARRRSWLARCGTSSPLARTSAGRGRQRARRGGMPRAWMAEVSASPGTRAGPRRISDNLDDGARAGAREDRGTAARLGGGGGEFLAGAQAHEDVAHATAGNGTRTCSRTAEAAVAGRRGRRARR